MRALLLVLALSASLLPLALELVLIRLRPQWFARLATRTLGQHTFVIYRPKANADVSVGYRDGLVRPSLPRLSEVIEFWNGRLIARDGVLMVQHASVLQGFRLLRIDVTQEGNTITLRARRIIAPISVVLVAICFGAICGSMMQSAAMGIAALVLCALVVGQPLATPREVPLAGAFVRIEREYRRLLEEPGSA
jgi:hypothetical protein